LPATASIAGRTYVIKKVDSSPSGITVDGDGTETIDGAETQSLSNQWDTIRIISDGANWLKI